MIISKETVQRPRTIFAALPEKGKEKNMEYKNYTTELPVTVDTDVVIVGGGTAGVAAAISAAKNGAKVTLLERTCALGGMMTNGLVQSLHGYRLHGGYENRNHTFDWSTPLIIENNLAIELFKRIQDYGGGAFSEEHYGDPSLRENIDEEATLYALDAMMKEYGVQVIFDTYAFDVVKEGSKVIGVVATNKSGAQLIKGKVIIDCSSDGDIAVRAGAGFEVGDEVGRTHGVCLRTEIGGINIEKFLNYLEGRPVLSPEEAARIKEEDWALTNGGSKSPDTQSLDGEKREKRQFDMRGKQLSWDEQRKNMAEGKFLALSNTLNNEWVAYLKDHPYPETPYCINTITEKPCYPRQPMLGYYGLVRGGKVRYDQMMSGTFECFTDCTDGIHLSEALMHMREINWIYLKFFRERIPGFEECYIIKTAPLYGARESRRIICDYSLTVQDVADGVQPEDTIAFSTFNNVHWLTGQQGVRMFIQPKRPFGISYRCMIPRNIDNVLVAGRCFSREFLVRSTGMPTVMSYGEAVGAAAAISLKDNVDVRSVDIAKVQQAINIDLEKYKT